MRDNVSKRKRPATLEQAARGLRLVALCALAAGLAACAQRKTMYNWQAYQPQVYAYLQDDGADYATQALALEKNIETARAANQPLPPGFHAHLGMLYLKMGNGNKAIEQLQSEKLAFPESAPFMDFLMRNTGKPDAGPGQPFAAPPSTRQNPPAAPATPTGT